jgi:hypothetical protein
MRRQPLLLLALLSITGCYRYLPVQVHVYDAQTMQPLQGIPVSPGYLRHWPEPIWFPPQQGAKPTDDAGLVTLKICPDYRDYASVVIETSRYRLNQRVEDIELALPPAEVWTKAKPPFRLEAPMLTIEEQRRRYQN